MVAVRAGLKPHDTATVRCLQYVTREGKRRVSRPSPRAVESHHEPATGCPIRPSETWRITAQHVRRGLESGQT
ncbi:hypothetical protein ANO14919_050010 [Xylariales sp. No.14919]|nr:hypothetical protein ANO14919_050010 [Xylariales sp. No.14919]